MQKELESTEGCIKSRQRALHLIKRVAKKLDTQSTPTNEEIIGFCTEITLRNCIFSNSPRPSSRCFQRRVSLQHWLTIAGPKEALTIIIERHSIKSEDAIRFYLFFTRYRSSTNGEERKGHRYQIRHQREKLHQNSRNEFSKSKHGLSLQW